MTTGSGHNHLQGAMSVLGVPVMSKWSFIKTKRDWRAMGECDEERLLEAGKEEN